MTTSREHLEKFSREDLIGSIQALEDSLAEAAKGLMTEGSAQELAFYKSRSESLERERHALFNALEDERRRLPAFIRWLYGI